MKKILIISDAWHPQVNGVVTALTALIKVLRARGYTVSIMHPELFRTIPFLLYPEVPLTYASYSQIHEFFEREKPDYVHIATEWLLGISARSYCLTNNIPFSTSYHTNFPLYVTHYFPFGKPVLASIAYQYMKWFHNPAYKTLVTTETLKREVVSKGFSTVSVWPLGVDTDFFIKTPSVDTKLTSPVFMYCGRIAKEKNIEAFLKLDLPGTKLVIGDGPERTRLEAQYPDAQFVGYKRGTELVEWISKADVCVFPSKTETFGLAVVEALSCGIPVAAHNVLGPKDIITHGVDGYLGDDLRTNALKCLNLRTEDCRAKALNYSLDHSTDEFLEHIFSPTSVSDPSPLSKTL